MSDRVHTAADMEVLDGVAQYRVGMGGCRIVVLPARCRRGHLLAAGYRVRDSAGMLVIRCSACAAAGDTDSSWRLRSVPPIANIAQLDDAAYPDLGR